MQFDFAILYVADARKSTAFYASLFGVEPLYEAEDFAMLPLAGDAKLGLWTRRDVKPASDAPAGGMELSFTVADAPELERMASRWEAEGITILQAPTVMDFGRTFTAADPDGHRIRVFVPAMR